MDRPDVDLSFPYPIPTLRQVVGELQTLLDAPLHGIWEASCWLADTEGYWTTQPVVEMKYDEVERAVTKARRSLLTGKKWASALGLAAPRGMAGWLMERLEACFGGSTGNMERALALVEMVSHPAMRSSHWEMLSNSTGVVMLRPDQLSQLTLPKLLELDSNGHEQLEQVSNTAIKEHTLERALTRMKEEWEPIAFDVKEYRDTGTRIIGSVDEMQVLLDDHIIKTQAMLSWTKP